MSVSDQCVIGAARSPIRTRESPCDPPKPDPWSLSRSERGTEAEDRLDRTGSAARPSPARTSVGGRAAAVTLHSPTRMNESVSPVFLISFVSFPDVLLALVDRRAEAG